MPVEVSKLPSQNSHSSRTLEYGVCGLAVGLGVAALLLRKPKVSQISQVVQLPELPKRLDFKYIKTLADDMSAALGRKVEPEQLECVVGKTELHDILPKLSKQNYDTTTENIEKGIFRADLHSHTNYSDGAGKTSTILGDAAEYGDKLFAKTGEKFLFALTDHNEIGAVKEALELIIANPERYKNIKFVPGVEMNFIHRCEPDTRKFGLSFKNPFQCSELLVHCINPYSKPLNAFIENLQKSRSDMIQNTINALNEKILGTKFSREEMERFFLKKPHENYSYNLHWRVLNYAQIKNTISAFEGDEFYNSLMSEWKSAPSWFDFNTRLCGKHKMVFQAPRNHQEVEKVCRTFFPRLDESENIIVSFEPTFDELIKVLSKEENISVGFAHPAFTLQCFKNPKEATADFIRRSNGLIQTTERYHMAYPISENNVRADEIVTTNNIIDEFKLLNVGGRDSHEPNLFKKG